MPSKSHKSIKVSGSLVGFDVVLQKTGRDSNKQPEGKSNLAQWLQNCSGGRDQVRLCDVWEAQVYKAESHNTEQQTLLTK